MKREYLKLCPFCGSTKMKITPKNQYMAQLKTEGAAFISIDCPYCGASKSIVSGAEDYDTKRAEAIAQWNIRSGF